MSYIGKNPKFNSTVLTDVGLAAVDSPASGSHKLVNRGGTVKVLDSAGSESSLGGGSGEINLVDNSSDAGNWAASGAGVTVATTTTSTDLPLGGVVDTAIKLTPVSGTDYARYRFTMPAGLKNRKLKIEWFQRPLSGYTSGDFKVEMYKNAASNYGGAYTEFTLSTDASGNTLIPNATGKFTTTFDADDGDYYELRYVRVAGTTALNLASVIVGPGTQPQGAVVGSLLTSVAPVAGWFGTGPTNVTTVVKQRQDGTTVDLKYSVVATGTSAAFSELTLNLPLGLTVDTSALSVQGSGRAPVGTFQLTKPGVGNYFGAAYYEAGLIVCRYILDTSPALQSVTNASPVAWNTTTSLTSIHVEINALPIAEWAGSGTVNVAQNDVEYVSWPLTSDANISNQVYGPSGSPFPSVNLTTTRVVTLTHQTPSQDGDLLILEYQASGGKWQPLVARDTGVDVQPYDYQNTVTYGANVQSISSTQCRVIFGQYAANNAGYGAAGLGWSTVPSTARWRVRKSSAGSAVGFGIVSATSSGLLPSSNSNLDDATATRLGLKQYLHGTTYNGGNAPTVSVGLNVSSMIVHRAWFIPYQRQDGGWNLKINITAASAVSVSSTIHKISINGVVFKNAVAAYQALAGGVDGGVAQRYIVGEPNANNISFEASSTNSPTAYYVCGDIELESKPTWAY